MFVICFEGGNGSGKSTQLSVLFEHLSKKLRCHRLHDPGISGNSECTRLREICTQYPFKSPYAPIYAFCAARAELIAEIARLDQNDECDVLFLDRFELSTYAYQMAPLLALGMDFDTAYDRVNAIAGSLHTGRPDILIFCDSIAEVGLERATSASDEPDQFEKQGVSYQNALLERYRILFKTGRFGHISIRVQPYPNLLSHELVDIYLLQVLELVHKYMETSPKPKTRLLVRED
jgi:dTMP kinase